jgi:chromosome segregation ATPase
MQLEPEVKQFFEEAIKHLEERINLMLTAAIEKMDLIADSIKEKAKSTDKEVERNKNSVADLYEKIRSVEKEVGDTRGRIQVLEDDKKDKQYNIGTIIAVVGLCIATVTAIIGWIL